nr:MAG TPA: hypothetical protein [Caudoviricetes sp.]
MSYEVKENLIVVLEDLDGEGRYFMEVYAGLSDCDEIAMRNCRNIHPDTVGHRLICVRVAR